MTTLARTLARNTAVPFDPNWKSIMEQAILGLFEMMAGVRLQLDNNSTVLPSGEQTAMVGLAGALCGMVTIRCSQATSFKFAEMMLGGEATPAAARDALGELTNMVAGNFKAKISNLADACLLSVPTVITGENYSMDIAEPSRGISIALKVETEPLWISLVSHG